MSKQRTFKKNGVKFAIVNNANYNKECCENSCRKYKLMKYDCQYNAWVFTGLYGDTISMIREEVCD